jgi:uncharacterized coiled-coil protein SlyX
MIWREKQIWLIVLALALAADVFVFVTYRVQFQERIEDVEGRKAQAEARLASVRAQRQAAQDTFARYRKVQSDLDVLYNTKWATRNERLIPWINDIKHLGEASKLVPRAISFVKTDEKEVKDPSLMKVKAPGTSSVTMSYSVQGNYQEVRRLINLLELSDQFVIIDSLSVTATENSDLLNVSLRLKTLFRELQAGQQEILPPVSQSTTVTPPPKPASEEL